MLLRSNVLYQQILTNSQPQNISTNKRQQEMNLELRKMKLVSYIFIIVKKFSQFQIHPNALTRKDEIQTNKRKKQIQKINSIISNSSSLNDIIACKHLLIQHHFSKFMQQRKEASQTQITPHNHKQGDHSLLPDLYTGWKLKNIPKIIFKQIPLVFAHQSIDAISKALTSFGATNPYQIVYMGFRPSSNIKLFKQYAENKNNKIVTQSLLYCNKLFKRFQFHHFHEPEKYFLIRPSEYRLFKGVNPTSRNQDFKFSSEFQCGNLDLAIAVNSNQYDLIMRVDSNTKGHTCWYFFKVYDIKRKKSVRFNIINFTKSHLLYEDGMKPYVFSKSRMQWSQQGIQVEYKKKSFRYTTTTNKPEKTNKKCLSFSYQLNPQDDEVYFAYSIPYSYSYLLEFLSQIQKKNPQFIKVNYGQQSTGGLPLPILTITNFTTNIQKQNHLAISRLHPGQTQGSWMIQGFIRFLCSSEAHYLRQRIQFKIIPMVNVDGVVLGNFRTGIAGRDLNRVFHQPKNYDQIKIIDQLSRQFKPQVFIDFHGHSAKKNVFIYGPDYKIDERDYLMCRLYPKIISKKTDAFRYYGCMFKINDSKVNTGRAILFNFYKTRFVYTVEASTHAYGYGKETVLFSTEKYVEVGSKIAESLQDFIKIVIKLPKNIGHNLTQRSHSKTSLPKNQRSKKKFKTLQQGQHTQTQKLKYFMNQFEPLNLSNQLIKQILENEKEIQKMQKSNQSDSDCEEENQDYTDQELKILQRNINANKTDPIDQFLVPKPKKHNKIRQKTLGSRNLRTLDVVPKKQLNKSFKLTQQTGQSQDLIQEISAQKQKRMYQSPKKQKEQKISDKKFFEKMMDSSIQKVEKLRKLQAWKQRQLKKSEQFQPLKRNRSANQVYLQCTPVTDSQRLNKIRSQMNSQHRQKQPITAIKRSFFPSIALKSSSRKNYQHVQIIDRNEYEKQRQKKLINQILQLHSNKKHKNNQNTPKKLKTFDNSNN